MKNEFDRSQKSEVRSQEPGACAAPSTGSRRDLKGLGLALTLLALTACHKPAAPVPAGMPTLPPATVKVQTVGTGKHLGTEEVVGTVRSRTRIVIEAKVGGRIEAMPVALGQSVAKGDLLFQLDVREIQARLDQAVALRRQAERDLERFANLLKQEAVTQAEYDGVEARQRVAQASVIEAETLLSYAKVVSPANLVVARKFAETGDLASPGRPLLELEDPTALRLEAEVPEALIGRIKSAAKLAVSLASLAQPVEGTVAEVAPSADPGSRTFRVKLDLPAVPGVLAGQFARVSVPLDETQTLRVPAAAVVLRGQMEIVFVATNQAATLRLVKTGKRFGTEVELVSGVSAGEQVVVEGAATLCDGQPLQVQ
jgi:RND family efflux transporter MFP subunit